MSIKFANIALPNNTLELESWVEENFSTQDIFEFVKRVLPQSTRCDFLGRPGIIDNLPRFKLNVLHWPKTASRFAIAHFLVTDNRLSDIQDAIGTGTPSPQTLEISWKDAASVISSNIKSNNQTPTDVASITPSMYMLAATPVAQFSGLPDPLRQLYILTLVDERFWWWGKDTSTISITEGVTTWAQLYTSLGSALGVTIVADTVASAYATPSALFGVQYEPIPFLLDAVAFACGQRIARTIDGTVIAQNPVNARTTVTSNMTLASARSLSSGGLFLYDPTTPDHLSHINNYLPGTIQVAYPKSVAGLLDSQDWWVDSKTLSSLALSDFPAGSTGTAFAPLFHHLTIAAFTLPADVSPSNVTALNNLTAQFATDYYRFRASEKVDIVYDGIVEWAMNGLSDFVEWTYKNTPQAGDCSTRIQHGDYELDMVRPRTTTGAWYLATTTVTLVASQNNYSVSSSTARLLVTTATNISITGVTGGSAGRLLQIENSQNSTGIITLPHESASSSPSNRIHSPTSWDEILNPGESCLLKYDPAAGGGTGRYNVADRVAGPAMPSSGTPTTASVSGAISVDTTGGSGSTSPSCGAFFVYFGSAWHHTAGGGTVHITGDRTFLPSDYTQCMDYRLATGGSPTVQTLPTTTPLDECWHSFQYNDPHYGTPATVLYVLESSPGTLFGLAFAGGGSWLFSHGGGEYIGVPIEPLRGVVPVTGATYTVKPEDENQVLDCTNAAGCTIAVPQSSNSGNFPASFRFHVRNSCAGSTSSPYGTVSLIPTTSTIDGLSLIHVFPRCTIEVVADGTNYKTERGRPPGGILEWSSASITLQGAHHGKLLVYTGAGDTDVNGDGVSTPAGLRVAIRNASSQGVVRFNRNDGFIDYIPPGQAYDLYTPDNEDSGTANYAMTGITEFGTNPKSGGYTVTRADQGRCIECTGAGDFTITGFTVTSDDVKFAFAIKNNTSGKVITFSPGGGQTVNGATSLRIDACQGVWIFADSANTRWVAVTGKACCETSTETPTHPAKEGTPYWETDLEKLYVNSDSSTTWEPVVPNVRKNSSGSTYKRKRLNFIEGSNVTLTVADDSTDEEVDITIASTGTGSPLNTKGDVYTYSTTNDRLPVSTNNYILTCKSSTSTGLVWKELLDVMVDGGYSFAQSIVGGGSPTSTDNYGDNFYSFGSLAVLFAVKNTGANILEWSIDVVDAFGSSHAGASTGTIAAGTEFDWNSRDKISTYSRTYGTWTIYFRSFIAGSSTTFDIAYSRIG